MIFENTSRVSFPKKVIMDELLIAIDGGGTKSEFLLFSKMGEIFARVTKGATNPNVIGIERACAVIKEGVGELLCNRDCKCRIFAGVAGAYTSQNGQRMEKLLHSEGLDIVVESDIMNVIYSSEAPGPCIAAIAGTGSAVFGYDGSNLIRTGGWGYLLDNAGGGCDIGRDILRLALDSEEDPKSEKLRLVEAAEELVGGRVIDNLSLIYERGSDYIASFAPLAFKLAREGDELSRRILRKSASRIAEMMLLTKGRIECGNHAIISGGLLNCADIFVPMIEDALSGVIELEAATMPQCFGACQRAFALAGIPVPAEFRDHFNNFWFGGKAADAVSDFKAPEFATEVRNPRTKHIDKMDAVSMVHIINDENARSVEAVGGAIGAISRAVDLVADGFRNGGRLIYIGAGTSGRLAVQDAAECPPTYGVDYDTVIANIAGGEGAVFRAVEQVEDSAEAGKNDLLARNLKPEDVVMGISASGNAAYVYSAMAFAKELGCKTISLSSNRHCRIHTISDVAIYVDTGAEAVTGSTRMKAGNAQKMVMNMITTCAMVMTGKVYENLMINLRPTNVKLKGRMVGIVQNITGADSDRALKLLEENGFSIRKAVEAFRSRHD